MKVSKLIEILNTYRLSDEVMGENLKPITVVQRKKGENVRMMENYAVLLTKPTNE
jgi:hypothetical protein